MENNNNIESGATNPKQQIPTSTAIIVAGFLIMVGILLTKTGGVDNKSKTLSEQVGVSKTSMAACLKEVNASAVNSEINKSVDNAMSPYPKNERGTPYTIVVGPNGFMTDIRGAESLENVEAIIAAAREGKLATEEYSSTGKDGKIVNGTRNLSEIYKGNVNVSEEADHIKGSKNPKITIIEYSDFECPYCKQFHPIIEKIVDGNSDVNWIYRHYPLHQHSFEKLVASNCVAKIKGDEAFWKYTDLLFGLLKTGNDSVADQL